MFLNKTVERNEALIQFSIKLHQSGQITPDTYVIDLDAIKANAKVMLDAANRNNVKLLFMTKQFGRNPILSKTLLDVGYEGAVAVDFRETETLHENGIPLAHVGHLVQTPTHMIDRVMRMNPELVTVYSVEKAIEINEVCKVLGRKQKILLRVVDREDSIYSGQHAGMWLDELDIHLKQLLELQHIQVSGLTSFPCFLFDWESKDYLPTNNVNTMIKARRMMEDQYGIQVECMNMPSATCTHTIPTISMLGGTHGEPGHGLLGTTPMHAIADMAEIPAIVYVSEISHRLDDLSYCYGGGYYQRTLVKQAIVADKHGAMKMSSVQSPDLDSIDYHFGLEGHYEVGQTVIMAFRTQIFVTRSVVAVVEGLSSNQPRLVGIHDSQGRLIADVAKACNG